MRIRVFWQTVASVALLLLAMHSTCMAEVIYRETFGRPGPPAATGNLTVQQWDWVQFNAGGAVHTGGNVNGTDPGRPTDLANTLSAGPHNDGTFEAYERGWHYFDGGATAPGARALSMTTEYSFNPADYNNNLKFSWWQGNTSTTLGGFQVAVRQGGSWYVSSEVINNTVAVTGGGNFGTMPPGAGGAEFMEFFYNPAPSNWLTLTFDGDYTLGATPGTGTATASTTMISQGGPPSSALSGSITAFGLYRNTYMNNSRFDSFTIESSGPAPIPGDVNGDGLVTLADFEPIRANFRKSVTMRTEGDLTGNGLVDFADFRQWKGAFLGAGGSLEGLDVSFLSVPEPGTVGLLLVGLAVGAARRARRSPATRT